MVNLYSFVFLRLTSIIISQCADFSDSMKTLFETKYVNTNLGMSPESSSCGFTTDRSTSVVLVLCVSMWPCGCSFQGVFCSVHRLIVVVSGFCPAVWSPCWGKGSWILCFCLDCGLCTVCIGLLAFPHGSEVSYVLWLWVFLGIYYTCILFFQ